MLTSNVEIPQIRVDYFRLQPHRPPPLACFLSHVHSDHLLGLESFKGPFIYCSKATREILLRLERYPHRMNFARGVTECRKQTYKHLSKLLRPIPLETPTRIELAPGNIITTTLFDANHCAGAVMFLLESRDGAALYTGDVRAEPWWVHTIARNPFLLPYINGANTKRLESVYLDTTFATTSAPFCKFPSKADGLAELLKKLLEYPSQTQFYFHAWTFGYEDVIRLLAHTLQSPVHLDRYRYSIYASLGGRSYDVSGALQPAEISAFSGFSVGNTKHASILTRDDSARLHSCERGAGCWSTNPEYAENLVHIKPIISRHEGRAMFEAGLGGGQGDLDQIHELELGDAEAIEKLIALCQQKMKDKAALATMTELLRNHLQVVTDAGARLRFDTNAVHSDESASDNMKPEDLAHLLQHHVQQGDEATAKIEEGGINDGLPKLITFPYSRHSSYEELRLLLEKLRPRDVWPCTAPKASEYDESKSMQNLFGEVCRREEDEGNLHFRWDADMREAKLKRGDDVNNLETQRADQSNSGAMSPSSPGQFQSVASEVVPPHQLGALSLGEEIQQQPKTPLKRAPPEELDAVMRSSIRRRAFNATIEGRWDAIGLECLHTNRRESREIV